MKLAKILLIEFLLSVSITAQLKYEGGLVSLKYEYEPLRTVLIELKGKTSANFIYSDDLVKNYRVSCLTVRTRLDDAIKKVLNLPNLAFKKFDGSTYVLFRKVEKPKIITQTAVINKIEITEIDSPIVRSQPQMISRGDPFYPKEAIEKSIEGKVVMRLLINKEGNVIKSVVENSSGFSILDDAATVCSRELKFSPALMNSKPVDIWLSMVFNYKLE